MLYAIDPNSPPDPANGRGTGAQAARVVLDAVAPVFGFGIVFAGERMAKKVQATHVAVDLTDVESADLDEALDVDTEASA